MAKPKFSISERTKSLRFNAGWTQEKLAEVADLPMRTVQSIEYAERPNPTILTVIKLANAFKMGLDEFVFGKPRK